MTGLYFILIKKIETSSKIHRITRVRRRCTEFEDESIDNDIE